MYTANTMASSFEALGMSLLYSSTMANIDSEKFESTAESARVLVEAVKKGLKPRDIVTRESVENAIALVMATGGSTNAVLHYLAICHAAGVEWTLDDFERVRRKVPVICDLKPSGKYMAVDLHKAGGIPQILKLLLNAGLLHGDCITVTAARWPRNSPTSRMSPRRTRMSSDPWTRRSTSRGIWPFCAAISPRGARWPRSRV